MMASGVGNGRAAAGGGARSATAALASLRRHCSVTPVHARHEVGPAFGSLLRVLTTGAGAGARSPRLLRRMPAAAGLPGVSPARTALTRPSCCRRTLMPHARCARRVHARAVRDGRRVLDHGRDGLPREARAHPHQQHPRRVMSAAGDVGAAAGAADADSPRRVAAGREPVADKRCIWRGAGARLPPRTRRSVVERRGAFAVVGEYVTPRPGATPQSGSTRAGMARVGAMNN